MHGNLLNVVENIAGDSTKADDTEQYVIEEDLLSPPNIFRPIRLA